MKGLFAVGIAVLLAFGFVAETLAFDTQRVSAPVENMRELEESIGTLDQKYLCWIYCDNLAGYVWVFTTSWLDEGCGFYKYIEPTVCNTDCSEPYYPYNVESLTIGAHVYDWPGPYYFDVTLYFSIYEVDQDYGHPCDMNIGTEIWRSENLTYSLEPYWYGLIPVSCPSISVDGPIFVGWHIVSVSETGYFGWLTDNTPYGVTPCWNWIDAWCLYYEPANFEFYYDIGWLDGNLLFWVGAEQYVNQRPVVDITSPPKYLLYTKAQTDTITISGSAYDPDGTVDYVEIRIDDGSWETVTGTTSWSHDWDIASVDDGNHTIEARSIDDMGKYSLVKSMVICINQMIFHPKHCVVGDTLGIEINPADFGESTPYSWIYNTSGGCSIEISNYVEGQSFGLQLPPPPPSLRGLWMGWDLMGKPPGFPDDMEIGIGDGFCVAQDGWYDVQCYINSGNGKFTGDTWTALFTSTFVANWGVVRIALDIAEWSDEYLMHVPDGWKVYFEKSVGGIPKELVKLLITFGIGELLEEVEYGFIIDGAQQIFNLWEKTDETWYHDLGLFSLDQPVWLEAGKIYVPRFRLYHLEAGEYCFGMAGSAYMKTEETITISKFVVSHNNSKSFGHSNKPIAVERRNNVRFGSLKTKSPLKVDDEGDGDFVSIREAIDYASPGDTIEVYSGTYHENVALNNHLTLIGIADELGSGSDTGKPVLNGFLGAGRIEGSALYIATDNCTIEGLKILGSMYGIMLDHATHCTISNNHIAENHIGICFDNTSSTNDLNNNTITENHFGLAFYNSSSQNIISADTIQANWFGVIFTDSSNGNEFSDGIIAHSNSGVISMSSSENAFTNNNFWMNCNTMVLSHSSSNDISSNSIVGIDKGVYLLESYDNTIQDNDFTFSGITIENEGTGSQAILGNTINGVPIYYYSNLSDISVPTDAGQVILENCTNFTIQQLNISEVDCGIQLVSCSDISISQCDISECVNGIILDDSQGITIFNNTFLDNHSAGVIISESPSNQIVDNTFTNKGITLRGDSLSHWNTHTVQGNTVNGKPICYYANADSVLVPNDAGQVIMANCTHSEINGANISEVDCGIQLAFCSENEVTKNHLRNNTLGVRLKSSFDNLIYDNYFDNTSNAWDDGVNTWYVDRPTSRFNIVGGKKIAGNFWHDYSGSDTDQDGIGDKDLPYNSNGGIQTGGDEMPLVPVINSVSNLNVQLGSSAKSDVGDIYLYWTEPYAYAQIDYYIVYRDTLPGLMGDSIAITTDTSYIDAGAAGNLDVNYYYAVKAVDKAGNISSASNQVGEFDMRLIEGK